MAKEAQFQPAWDSSDRAQFVPAWETPVTGAAAQAPAGLSYMGTGLSKACQPAGLAPMG